LCRGVLAARVWTMLDPEFVLDADARERLLDRFGPDAEPWCDGLAALVAGYGRRCPAARRVSSWAARMAPGRSCSS
jgi:hypothetical protein